MHLPTKTDIISISLPFSEASNDKISFIIDTGSMISLIKMSQISNKQKIQYNKVKILKGVSGDTIQTVGSVVGTISFQNKPIKHEFYLVPDYLNFGKSNAILGLDFLSANNVIIDTKYKKLIFREDERTSTDLANNSSSVTKKLANEVISKNCSMPRSKNKKKRVKSRQK